ncbi:hypothetical protein AAG570_013083 [Ranatra chinensis]|uniref:Uncharacterized protein n=1 Tax=Ranatra chinensis TaxID=642074 RepID=A0ABD0YFT0_9HEMI
MATGHAHTGRTGPLAGPTATTCRIESAGNVVKIRVTPRKEARPGQFRTAVRIYRGDDEEEGMVPTGDSDPYTGVGDSGQASPADSGTCSDLDAGSPPPGHRDDEETSSDSLNGSETDGYEFHLNELGGEPADSGAVVAGGETFAGRVYPCCRPIHSANGTVRGVKNRVRAGIATFLEINNTKVSSHCHQPDAHPFCLNCATGPSRLGSKLPPSLESVRHLGPSDGEGFAVQFIASNDHLRFSRLKYFLSE